MGSNVRGDGVYAAAGGHLRTGGLAGERRDRMVRLRGGRLAAAVCADGAALWFKRPNPVIFVPVDFTAIGVYLLYIDLATRGGWFFSFALPVTGAAMVLVTAVVTLLRYVPSGTLYTLGGGLILAGGYAVLVEFC